MMSLTSSQAAGYEVSLFTKDLKKKTLLEPLHQIPVGFFVVMILYHSTVIRRVHV